MTIFDIIAEGPVVFADETTGYVFAVVDGNIHTYSRASIGQGMYIRSSLRRLLPHDWTLDDAHEAAEDWFTDLTCSEAA